MDPRPMAVGIDLGGSNLRAALVDDRARIITHVGQPTGADRGPDAVITDMVAMVHHVIDEWCRVTESTIRLDTVLGVGVGAPGPLSVQRGRIIRAANLPGWSDVPLRDTLSQRLGVRVELDNDGNVAALGEYWVRGSQHDLVMLTLGTGVGAGVVMDGKIVHGHYENAGELGHMIVVPDGLACNCGQRGCLEAYASASNVVRRVVEGIQSGEPSCLSEAVRRGEIIPASRVGECAADGDKLCERIWDEACKMLAIACVNIQHAFNPSIIVLGGGLGAAGSALLDRVSRHVQDQRWSLHDDFPSLERSRLGADAGVVGAAALILTSHDPNPTD
jgi:glucokinase